MNKPLSPEVVQALIWIVAVVIVIVAGVVAFAINRPAPAPAKVPAAATQPAPPGQSTQPAQPAAPGGPPGQPSSPTQPPGTPSPPPGTTRGQRAPTQMNMRSGTSSGLPPMNPPPPGSVKVTEDIYIDIAAKMLLIAEGAARTANVQKAAEQAYKDLLINRGVSEADFRKYSDAVAGDPKRRDRIKQLILARADQLRLLNPTARAVPNVGTRIPARR